MLSHPVSFTPGGGDAWRDPFGAYAALRDHDPVHHVAGDGGPGYWVLTRFADVWRAARDTATFSSAEGLTTTPGERERIGLDEARPLVMMDPPEHTDFRRLVARGFTPRQVATLEPVVRAFVRERLDRLADAGGGDVVAELFKPLPSMVVAHYLGVPPADRGNFDRWTEAIVDANALGDVGLAAERLGELLAYFGELIERRRVEPGDDVVSDLVGLAPEESLPVLRILGFAFTMVAGGNDTTTGLLGGAAILLTERRDQRQVLLDDPTAVGAGLDELLRLTSPVQCLARTTTRAVVVDGVEIPAGEKVLLHYGSANRDPREFGPTADELDLGRSIDKILTFGYGAHHCLGASAARLQGRVAIEELLARFPDFEVDADAVEYAPGSYVRRPVRLPFRTGARDHGRPA